MRYNPFNPQLPAKPEFFVGRFNEIRMFEQHLSQTINGSPMNMTIGGNRGIGKTSILIKFEEIARAQKCLVIRISNLESRAENLSELAELILTNLKLEYLGTVKPVSEQVKHFLKSINLNVSVGDVDLGISFKRDAGIAIARESLEKFWEHIQNECQAAVILIDEAESIERIDGALMFLREVFQRLGHGKSKYMLVLCGKLNFPEAMSEAFSPLNRFFPGTKLIPLNREETNEFLEKSLSVVGCKIEKNASDFIFEKSEGHPYIMVSMAFNIFNELGEGNTLITKKSVSSAMNLCESRLEQDYFMSLFHPLTPKCKNTLVVIADQLHATRFTFAEAVNAVGSDGSQVAPYIQEMCRKGCINKTGRGKYEIFHKLFLDFLKRKAKNII